MQAAYEEREKMMLEANELESRIKFLELIMKILKDGRDFILQHMV
jgi:hypothetical protein